MKYRIMILSIIFSLGIVNSAFAQTPTSNLRDSVRQKVAEELAQIKQAVAKKAFVGNITAKSDATLSLNNLENQSRTINLAPDSTIKLPAKEGTLADLKVGDFVIVMGDVDSQNIMTAKRILVITKPVVNPKLVASGRVTTVTPSSLTLNTGKNDTLILKISSATAFTGKTKLADIKLNSVVAIIYNHTPAANTATRIYLISSPAPSPTLTPTPKAVKASPTP